MKQIRLARWQEIVGTLVIVAVFTVPFLSSAKGNKQLYVDASTQESSNAQDGSSAHPYQSIGDAVDKADKSSNDVDIHIAKGTYKESFTLGGGMHLYGEDADKVIIDGRGKNSKPVITMKNKTTIDNITVENGGSNGIVVEKNSRASIIRCVIRDNDKDGIVIRQGGMANKEAVSIVDSQVRNNGRAGIYSEQHRVVIMGTEVRDNRNDGIALAAGVSAYIHNNAVSGNKGSGLAVTLDNATIVIDKGNSFRNNKYDGIVITGSGAAGTVSVKLTKIAGNDHYAVARVAKGSVSSAAWKGVTIENTEKFTGNSQGTVSPILR